MIGFIWAVLSVSIFRVQDFGAAGNGKTIDTASFQTAIDKAAKVGGEVLVKPGQYICGTIHLRSHIRLSLMPGASIVASPRNQDFDNYEKLPYDPDSDQETSDFTLALFAGRDIEDITISGEGTIDGNRSKRGNYPGSPGEKPIALKQCRDVTIRGIRIVNSPNYCVSMLGCEHVLVDGITINRAYCDGVDPDSCSDVRIVNCDIDTFDDSICPKASFSLGRNKVCENIVVSNCILRSSSDQFKLGTESNGGFRNITLSNCVMLPRELGTHVKRGRGGIGIIMMDGGVVDNIQVSHVVMRDLVGSIFVRLGHRGKHEVGSIRNVYFDHITGTGFDTPVIVGGLPGHPLENIKLDAVDLQVAGDQKQLPRFEPEEKPDGYPQSKMFGEPPAQAVFARHVNGLSITASQFGAVRTDCRPNLTFDDVKGVAIRACAFTAQAPSLLWLTKKVEGKIDDVSFVGPIKEIWSGSSGADLKLTRLSSKRSEMR